MENETLYGKYPKKITCECNAEEMNADEVAIQLNHRCPKCSQLYRVCVPKRESVPASRKEEALNAKA